MLTKKKLKFYKKKLTKFKFKIINILKTDSEIVFPTPETLRHGFRALKRLKIAQKGLRKAQSCLTCQIRPNC